MERKIVSLEKAKLHYKDSWTKALKELINGKYVMIFDFYIFLKYRTELLTHTLKVIIKQ